MSDPLEMTRDEALALLRGGDEGLEQWRVRRDDQSRTPIDLSGVDLRGEKLAFIVLYGVTFDGANLSGADLSLSNLGELVRVNLDGTNLSNGAVSGLTDCTARGADLTRTRLNSVPIVRTDLTGANLTRLDGGFIRSERSIFRNADLTGAELNESTFTHADFDGANLNDAVLRRCNLSGSSFRGAILTGVNLMRANLENADLTNADLTGANLGGANLTGAIVEGANFTNTNLYAAKLDALGPGQPIGFVAPEPVALERIGPAMRHLEAVWRKTGSLETSLHIDPEGNGVAAIRLDIRAGYSGQVWAGASQRVGRSPVCQAETVCEAMLELAQRWPKAGLYLETLHARTGGDNDAKRGLREQTLIAWHEAFGRTAPSQSERRANQIAHRQRFLKLLRGGPEGIEQWNALSSEALSRAGHFRQTDLSGCDLRGADLGPHLGMLREGLDFSRSDFNRANLMSSDLSKCVLVEASFRDAILDRASCRGADLRQTDMTGASLKGCSLRSTLCSEADFSGADLTQADLSDADMRGANLSSANLDQARFRKVEHDETTSFPEGFTFPEETSGLPPGVEVGSRVRIVNGAFMGSEAEVKTINESVSRVTVVVMLWGRPVDVELEYDEVS